MYKALRLHYIGVVLTTTLKGKYYDPHTAEGKVEAEKEQLV